MSEASLYVCVTLPFLLFFFCIFCSNLSALETDIALCCMEIITLVIGNLTKFFFPHPLRGTADNRILGVKLSFRLWERRYSYGNDLEIFHFPFHPSSTVKS